jgi:hypothetical protein
MPMPQLNEKEKLIRDYNGLRDSLRLDMIDMTRPFLTNEEKKGLRNHMNWIISELNNLRERLEELETAE